MNTSEKSKSKTFIVLTLDNKLKNKEIRDDHALQRLSSQWSNSIRDNLIARCMNDDPIPAVIIAEQGMILWLLDGKQRITTIVSFRRNLFKIGKNIDRPIITYNHVDNSGEEPVYEECSCDIRGKYYRDLPIELQERFDNYEVTATVFLGCSDEDIEYHIRCYNSCKPMTAAQKGITYLGDEFARVAKRLCNHDFFKNSVGKYGEADRKNGTLERVITESIMAINFLPNWKKKNEDMCAYLKEHVTSSAFDVFENYLDRLTDIIGKESKEELFNARDSFLFFALFDKFAKSNLDDEKFGEFIDKFKETLRYEDVNGASWETLSTKGTKDKKIVAAKVDLLEILMNEYLHIETRHGDVLTTNDRNMIELWNEADISDFFKAIAMGEDDIHKAVSSYLFFKETGKTPEHLQDWIDTAETNNDVLGDLNLYLDILNDWSLDVDNNSRLFSADNIPVVLSVIEYAVKNDIDDVAHEWFVQYVENFDTGNQFGLSLAENYTFIKDDLDKYITYLQKKSA